MAPASDPADVELLERARSGDIDAFRAVVSYWGKPAIALATILTGDERRGLRAVRAAFLALWRTLPTTHSQTPFRPEVLGAVVRAAPADVTIDAASPLQVCLAAMDEQTRAAAALWALGYPVREIGLALDRSPLRTARSVRTAIKTLQASVPEPRKVVDAATRRLELPSSFFETALLPDLDERVELEFRRRVEATTADVWRALTDPAIVSTWMGEQVDVRPRTELAPGSRISTTVARMREVHTVTRAAAMRSLGWTSRSRAGLPPAIIEHRWSVVIEPADRDVELIHRLHGHALPPGPGGRSARRSYAKRADAIPAAGHKRLERIAAAAEAMARGAPL